MPGVLQFRVARIGLLLSAMLAAMPVAAAELIVPAGQGALQRIINSAQAGDILRLASGDHQGPVTVSVPLQMLGADGARVTGTGSGSVITVDAPDVTVANLIITGSGLSHETLDAGVKLTK